VYLLRVVLPLPNANIPLVLLPVAEARKATALDTATPQAVEVHEA
jgi:hypothetical protein